MSLSQLFTTLACFLLCAMTIVAVESPVDGPGVVDIKAILSQVMGLTAQVRELKAEVEKLKSAKQIASVASRSSSDSENYIEDARTANNNAAIGDTGGSRKEVKQLITSEPEKLKTSPKIRRSAESSSRTGGTSYIRWGRTTCDGNAISVYRGYAAGPHYNQGGGGSNFLCLHENPQWNKYFPVVYGWTGMIYGVGYEIHSDGHAFATVNNGGDLLHDYPSPCVACFKPHASTTMMIPGRIQCPTGWNIEYHGYIVSEATNSAHNRHRSQYACWDNAPESAVGGTTQHQSVIYPVHVGCGSLPCSRYVSGRGLTCVVCSR